MNAKHISSPRWQSAIKRTRLLEELNSSIEYPLTLVIAPSGYGKTTLVSQFVQGTDIPAAWHTLENRDKDIPTLFNNTLKSLSQVIPSIENIALPINTTAGELATFLCEYIRDNVADEFLYVIDDIHLLLEAPNAKTWLKAFITSIPHTCHLVLIGQALPPLSLEKLIARDEIISIGQENLSFTLEEVKAVANQIGTTLSVGQIDDIYSRMLGWPAGTVLALKPFPTEIEATLFKGEKAPEALFDALADRLFQAQTAEIQVFLLSSSTLPRITPALCQSALGLIESSKYLAETLQKNLFLTEISGGLAYHTLFRDFLQNKFQTQNYTQYIEHHLKAGQWFESENRLEEAFDHYVAAKHWNQAAYIAEQTAHLYMAQGKSETLLHWEASLTTVNIHAPRFFYMCAMIHLDRHEYEFATDSANRADRGYRARENIEGCIQITLFKANMNNQQGYFREAIEQAEPIANNLSLRFNLRGYALAIIGTAHLHLNNLDKALDLLQRALPLWRETGDQFAVAQLLLTVDVLYSRVGQFSEAMQCLQEALSIHRALGESISIAMATNNLGYHQHLLGNYQEALSTVEKGLQISSRIPENRADSFILLTMGDLQRDRGAFREAEYFYQRALQQLGDKEPFLQASILISFATLRRWENKLDESQQLALKAVAITEKYNLNWENLRAKLALYAISVYQHKYDTISHTLESITTAWQTHPSPELAPVIAIRTYAMLLDDDEENAHKLLKLSTSKTNHPANLQPLFAEIVHTPLLKTFLHQYAYSYKILNDGVQCLERMQIVPEMQSGENSFDNTTTYSLRISVLGHEFLDRDGVIIPTSAWQAKSARKLFYHLLFKGKSTKEEIGLAIWPDSSSEQMSQKFHSTLARARKAVGKNAIIHENDFYFVNPDIDLWCDAFEFKVTVRQAQSSSLLLSYTESLWNRAIALYQGDFLVAFDDDWITSYRETLIQMYRDGLVAFGNCIRIRGNALEAITVLKQALKVDPFYEDAHRAILNCYAELGERSFIVQHMNELTGFLDKELGITPSSETITLSQKLLVKSFNS